MRGPVYRPGERECVFVCGGGSKLEDKVILGAELGTMHPLAKECEQLLGS